MNKTAKTAIVFTIIFLVSILASAAFFIAAAPEYPRYEQKLNEHFNNWIPKIAERFNGLDGKFNADGDEFEFHFGEDGSWIRGKDKDGNYFHGESPTEDGDTSDNHSSLPPAESGATASGTPTN